MIWPRSSKRRWSPGSVLEINNAVVTVKGDVRTADEKNKITERVRAAPGVKDMANALEIKPPKP